MNGRSHNVTLGVGFIISCVIMLFFLLNKTHEKLEDSRSALLALEDKYSSLVKQFEGKFLNQWTPLQKISRWLFVLVDQTVLMIFPLIIFSLFNSTALYEYKERLEHSFMSFKEKKSPILNEADTVKSELQVLKSSHRNEIQRLHVRAEFCLFAKYMCKSCNLRLWIFLIPFAFIFNFFRMS